MSMASIDQSKLIVNKNDEKINKNSTKVVIIASVDDDDERILSYLNTTDAETILLNLEDSNKKNLTNSIPLKDESSINRRNSSTTRKRKADLTCVVCDGEAMGYNFSQITCESCKAFFRRNALHPIEKTKCLKNNRNNTEIFCEIKSTLKHKCQRCRLLKCFQNGMRKDYILTHEEKLIKKQRLEENRQLRHSPIIRTETTKYSSNDKSIKLTNIPSPISSTLTPEDWTCLKHIENSYLSASQSSPSASSVVSLELAPDKMSAFMYTFDIQNFAAVKLINFLREIPEFEQLNEHDRLLLVKYNLTLLFLIRHSLTYDSGKEICYHHDTPSTISPTDEAFAQHCKSLFILCYGYEFHRAVILLLDNLSNLTNRDPLITQLIMLIVIFSKGLSADGDQEPILEDSQLVLQAQSKYTDLLIRYLMNNSTYESVPMKMVRLVQQILRIQKISRDFQQYVKTKVDVTYINPLMKSLLHLT